MGLRHSIFAKNASIWSAGFCSFALAMRSVCGSFGERVKIFNLAKNAGTSVDQIERFYARNLPLSKEMALNLQSFGSGLT